jgi:uncharacterized repeat protein (TIGR02543 family)
MPFRKVFRKEFTYLGTALAVIIALISPLVISQPAQAVTSGTVTNSVITSTGGGSVLDINCPTGYVLRAVRSGYTNFGGVQVLSAVKAVCYQLSSDGNNTTSTSWVSSTYGGTDTSNLDTQNVDCTNVGSGYSFTGARVYTNSGYAAGVHPYCGKLASGNTRSYSTAIGIGTETSTYQDISCAANTVAVGLHLSTGSIDDKFGFNCGPVTGATQTITFGNPGSKTYGTSFTPSASTTSSSSVTFSSSTTSICTVSGTTVSLIATGTCTIKADAAADTNYNAATSVNQSFSVTQATQPAITVTSTSGTYGVPLTLTTSGGGGTGAVTYTTTNGTATGCSVSAGVLSSTSSGTCSVTATQAADSNYLVASSAATTVTLSAAAALTPVLSAPTFNTDGTYTIQVTNYDSNFTWTYTVNAGTRVVGTPSGSSVSITVTPPVGSTSALTVATSRTSYNSGSTTGTAYYPGCATTTNPGVVYTSISFLSTAGTCQYNAPAAAFYDYLVVGGGGAGGDRAGGGGGAGGYLTSVGDAANGAQGTRLSLTSGQIITITVGAGASSAAGHGGNGSNSVLVAGSTYTANGGGGGGTGSVGSCTANSYSGNNGGSGGGADGYNQCSPVTGGTGVTGQGNAGAVGSNGSAAANWTGGGGGGGGSAGVAGNSNGNAGSGGAGLANSISGTAVCYASGGGGGNNYQGGTVGSAGACGALTGAGAGSKGATAAGNGAPNTGQGGGGSGFQDGVTGPNGTPGAGGSGIIVLRYATATPTPTLTVTGVTTSGYTLNVTNYDGNFIYTPTVTSGTGTIGSATYSGTTASYPVTGVTSGYSVTARVAVTLSSLTSVNASITGTANQAAQTISFTSAAPTAATFGGTYTVTATSNSGLAVVLSIDASATSVCSLSGSTVTYLTAGTCVIDANQAGNTQYLAATQVQQSFSIAKATQGAITVTSTTGTYGSTVALTYSGGSGTGAVTFAIVAGGTATGCSITGTTLSFTSNGTCLVAATKAADGGYNAQTSATATVTISKLSLNITFSSNWTTVTTTTQSAQTPGAVLNANTFIRAGYVFTGWNTSADGTGTAYANSATVNLTASTTLYAQWLNHPSSLTYNDQSGNTRTISYTPFGSIVLTTATRTGYVFKGWSTDSAGTNMVGGAGATYSPNSTTSLGVNYNFDDSSSYSGSGTTVTDVSPTGGANGSITGTGGSYSYSAANPSYLTISGGPYVENTADLSTRIGTGSVSIFLWINASADGVIVSELGQYAANTTYHDSNIEVVGGKLKVHVWNGSATSAAVTSSATVTGAWHYVGFTYVSGTLTEYIDGVATGSSTLTRVPPTTGLYYAIGAADATNMGSGVAGSFSLGSVQIYGTQLSATTVANNYQASCARYSTTGCTGQTLYAQRLPVALAPTASNPVSQNASVGQTVTFTTTASTTDGGTLTYQWAKNGVDIAGATLATFTINSVASTDVGSYSVRVTNTLYGGQTYVSSASVRTTSANLTVVAAPVITTPTTGLSATYNSAYTLTVVGSTSTTGATFSVATGPLPAGLSLNSNTGVISGTPTAAGSYSVSVRISDDNRATATTAVFAIVVAKAGQTITFGALSGKTMGMAPFVVTATASSALTVTFSVANNTYCSVTATGTVTLVAPGSCTIQADQTGDTNWTASVRVSQTFTISPTLTITTPSAGLTATVGVTYTLNTVSAGGAGTNTWAVASGTLPTGLTINSSTGAITGTPTVVGPQTITVRVTDANTATATTSYFVITVAKGAQTISFVSISARKINDGVLTVSPTASSGNTVALISLTSSVCSVNGFNITTLSAGTCSIRADQAGDANWSSAPSVTQSFAITGITVIFNSNFGTPVTTTQLITLAGNVGLTANTFAQVGFAFTGWTTNADGTGTAYVDTASVRLTGDTTLYAQWVGTSFTVSYVYNSATGGNTTSSDTYNTGGTALTLPTPTRSGYVFAGWYSNSGLTTFIGAGGASYTPSANGSAYAKWLAVAAAPTVATPSGANKTNGQSVTFTATASTTDGGTLTYQWIKNGTDIAGATGASYTFNVSMGDAGNYSVRVTNTMYSGQSYQSQTSTTSSTASLSVVALPSITTPPATLNATFNSSFSISITGSTNTTGKAFSVVGSAPAGLSIDASTGTFSGTPSAAGNYYLQFKITDDNGASVTSGTILLVVAQANQTISFSALSNRTLGTGTFTVSASATSGGAVTFSTANSSICSISGSTVTLVATGTCTVRADQAGNSNWAAASQLSQTFTIASALTVATPTTGLSGTYNSAFSLSLSSTGGGGSNGWAVVGGSLPAGLRLDSVTGIISGTPTAAGDQTISVRVTDANGATANTSNFMISVAKTSQAISFGVIASRGLNSGSFALSPTATSGSTPVLMSNDTSICTVSSLTVTLLTAGTCSLTANEAGNSNYLAANAVTQNFTVNPVNITYNSNFGVATTTVRSVTSAGNQSLAANSFARDGYSFAGWNTQANGGGTNYANLASVAFVSDVTLYAKWTADAQTVSYSLNAGTGTAPASASVNTDASFTVSAGTNLAKTGYTFGGWNDGAATYQVGNTYTVGARSVTLAAVWTANTYVVSFAYNNATGGFSTSSSSFTTGGSAITLPSPTRLGYTFQGWFDDSSFSNLIGAAGASYSPNGTVTTLGLYAKWAVAVGTISYNANGGTGSATGTQGNTLATITVGNGSGITNGGYTLVGWNTAADGTGTEYTIGGSMVMPAGGGTLYADWNANTYNVAYSTGGGSTVATSTYVTAGTITLPANPTRAGWSFNGWFAAATGGSALGSTYSPSGYGDITLYAQWTGNVQSISYDANSGTGTIVSTSTRTGNTETLDSGSSFSRTGYTLTSWNTAADGSGTSYTLNHSALVPANGLALFAIWTPVVYHVSYDANNATSGTAVTDSGNYNIGQIANVMANTGSLARTGYTFAGWNTAADGSGTNYASGGTVTLASSSLVLYAKWTANTYVISYNVNGASGTPQHSGVAVSSDNYTTGGSTVGLPDVGTMVKVGYTFAGWSTSPSGSAIVGAIALAYTTTSNQTLFALWTIKTLNITFDAGTQSGTTFTYFPSNDARTYGTAISVGAGIDAYVVTNGTRYDFVGWNDGNTTFAAGETYSVRDTDVTFTALWAPVYGVRYSYNGGTPPANFTTTATECAGTDATCGDQQQITLPDAPTRDGYIFNGWIDQSGQTGDARSSYTVTAGHYLLYAQWTAINYHVTYDSNGGSTAPTENDQNIGGIITIGAAPTRTGYSFNGWNGGAQLLGAGASYTIGTTDVRFTADWTPNVYAISYDWNGGQGSAASSVNYTVGNPTVTLPVVTDQVKDGYIFRGWSLSASGSALSTVTPGSPDLTYTPTADTMLYAVWGLGDFTLTTDGNGGSASADARTGASLVYQVANGSAQTLPSANRSHFHFDGWYAAAGPSTRIGGAGDSYTPTASTTLYAHWTQDSLYGIGASTKIGSLNTVSGIGAGYTAYGPSSNIAITVPANALPAGTSVDVYLLVDTSHAQSLISGLHNYVMNMVVSWLAADGTVPSTASGKPISVTLSDPNIKAGASVYSLVGGTATFIGVATVDGQVSVNITDDPELVVTTTVPSMPLSALATAGDGFSTVSWTAPTSTGGSAITSYLVTASNGSTCTVSAGNPLNCDIHGLTNGSSYTFSVQALNSVGTSQASASTGSVTPMAVQTITFATPSNRTLGTGTYSVTATASSGLAVSYSTANSAICTASSNVITLVGAGTCTVYANQSGDYRTLAAAQVGQSFTVSSALNIATPSTGITGSYNSAFSLSLSASGGAGSNSYAISSGSLPAGLSLDSSTGVISGTPSISATKTIAVSVTDANGATTATSSFTLTINTIAQAALSVTSTSGTYGAGLALAVSGGTTSGSVSYTSTDGTTSCTISAGVVTSATAGTCNVTATMAGDSYYSPVSSTSTTITFAQAAQNSLSITTLSGTYGTALTMGTSGGSGLGSVTYAATAGSVSCSVSGGTVTASGAGTCDVRATKAADSDYSSVTSASVTLVFATANQSALSVSTLTGSYGATLSLNTSGGSGTGATTYSVADGTATCSLSGNTLSVAGAGTCLVTAARAGDANYNSVTSSQATVTFNPANQDVVSLTSTSGVYGTSLTLTATGGSGTGSISYAVANGTANCTLNAGVITAASAGTCSVVATRASDANYNSASSISTTVTFSLAPQSITFGSLNNQTLNGTAAANVATASATSGLTVVFTSLTPAVCSVSAGTVNLVGSGTCTVAADQSGDTRFGAASRVTQSFTVSPAVAFTTPTSGLTGSYNNSFSLDLSTLVTGGSGSHSYAVETGSLPAGLTLDPSTGVISGVPSISGSGTVTVSATDTNNASATTGSFTITVNTIAQSALSLTSTSGTYGSGLALATTGGSSNGAISYVVSAGSTSCTLTAGVLTASGAGTCSVRAQMAGDAYYSVANSANTTVTFGKAVQASVTVTSTTGTYGVALPLTAVGGSGAGNLSYSVTDGSVHCSISGGQLIADGAGSCDVTATRATDANYLAKSSNATTVTFAVAGQSPVLVLSTDGVYGTALAMEATGGNGTGAYSFTVADGTATCTLTGIELTVTEAGTCVVTAIRAGDSNYNQASSVATTVTIGKANQTINFGSLIDQTLGNVNASPIALSGTSSSTLGVDFTALTSAVCSISGGVVSVTAAGTCTIAADQSGDARYSAAPRVSRSFTVSPALTLATPTTGLSGNTNSTYSLLLVDGGGSSNHTFGILTGSLPDGILLNAATGLITGVTTSDARVSLSVRVTDSNGATADTAEFVLEFKTVVAAVQQDITPLQIVNGAPSTQGKLNSAISAGVSAMGGVGKLVYSLSGTLPAGLSLNSATGAITGIAKQAGTYSVIILVTDSHGTSTQSQVITIVIDKIDQAALSVSGGSLAPGGTLALSANGGSGIGAVTYAIVGPNTGQCSISGSILTATNTGSCLVVAVKAGDSNYIAATSVEANVQVSANGNSGSGSGSGTGAGTGSGTGSGSGSTDAGISYGTPVVAPAPSNGGTENSGSGTAELTTPVLVQNGTATAVTTTNTSDNLGLQVTTPEWSLTIKASTPAPLSSDNSAVSNSQIQVAQGGIINVNGDSFQPLTVVEVWVASTPTLLGTTQVRADGTFVTSITVPAAFQVGNHTLILQGLNSAKQVQSVQAPLQVQAAPAAAPAGTLTLLFGITDAHITTKIKSQVQAWAKRVAATMTVNGTKTLKLQATTFYRSPVSIPRAKFLCSYRAIHVGKLLKMFGVKASISCGVKIARKSPISQRFDLAITK